MDHQEEEEDLEVEEDHFKGMMITTKETMTEDHLQEEDMTAGKEIEDPDPQDNGNTEMTKEDMEKDAEPVLPGDTTTTTTGPEAEDTEEASVAASEAEEDSEEMTIATGTTMKTEEEAMVEAKDMVEGENTVMMKTLITMIEKKGGVDIEVHPEEVEGEITTMRIEMKEDHPPREEEEEIFDCFLL